jgi:hypothetical protein
VGGTSKLNLDITLMGDPIDEIHIVNIRGEKVEFCWEYKIPRLFRYQRLELETLINNSPKQDLRISTKIIRWLLRDLIKHPKFIIHSVFNTKRIITDAVSLEDLPLRVALRNNQQELWVSRNSIKAGIFPSNLDESLEYDRLRNPSQFKILVRDAYSRLDFRPFRNTNYTFHFPEQSKNMKFGVEYEVFENAEVLHGRFALCSNNILQISNTRKEIIRRSPGYIESHGDTTRVLNAFGASQVLEKGVFFGSNLNWFHFIVECLTRYMAIPEIESKGTPILLESGVHPNIIEICRVLSKTEPVLIGPFDRVEVKKLFLCREFGVDDSIDSSPRSELLHGIRKRLLEALPPTQKPKMVDNNYFLRRKANLFRPLQNEKQLLKNLKKLNFRSVYPEDLSLFELLDLMNGANLVLIESGAAMTNLMFAPSWVKVIEINPGDGGYGFWGSFLDQFGLEYSGLVGHRRVFGAKGICSDGYAVALSELRKLIISMS